MNFFTVINCMDGRVQLPVIDYLKKRFNADYIDNITEAGPNLILSDQKDHRDVQSILKRLNLSIMRHHSKGIAVVGHHDCAGNPAEKDAQIEHIDESMQFIQKHFKGIEIIGLWVDENWDIQEIEF